MTAFATPGDLDRLPLPSDDDLEGLPRLHLIDGPLNDLVEPDVSADRLDWALRLARAGFQVISCWSTTPDGTCRCRNGAACTQKPGKHPVAPDGHWHETADEATIRTLLAAGSEPNYGVVPPLGCLALDVDGAAVATIARLEAELGPLPATYEHRTRNGRHLFYRWPAAIDRPGRANLFGIVTRWGAPDGSPGRGYVIGPGSAIGTFEYSASGAPEAIAELPEAWARAALIQGRAPRPDVSTIAAGFRHPELRDAARYLRGRAFEGAALRAAVGAINAALPEPKTAAEVERAIGDVERKFGPDSDLAGSADIHSGEGDAPAAGMNFRTARELFAAVPERTLYRWQDYLPDGAIVEIDGRAKAAGKTTFLGHLTRAVLDGTPFLGRPTRACPVVMLSEQPVTSLRASLAPAGLIDRDDFRILTWGEAIDRQWRDVAAAALAACLEVGAGLLVVDTLPQWAGLRGDLENASGAALEAIEPLQRAAAAGLAVLVVRHDRKGSGEVGESARGSSAFGGAVDVILQLRRGGPEERPTVRYLSALSRFAETPPELVVELTDAGYVVLGDATGYAAAEGKQKILELIAAEGEMKRADIETVTGIGGERLTAILAELVAGGFLGREGRGVKGDPQRFHRLIPIHSGALRVGARRNELASPPAGSGESVGDRMAGIFAAATDDGYGPGAVDPDPDPSGFEDL